MWYHGNLNDDVMNCLHSLSQWNNSIQVTNSQMFDFHTADAIASSLLTMAVCSICVAIPCNICLRHWAEWVPKWPASSCLTLQYPSYSAVWWTLQTVLYITVHIRHNVCVRPEDLLQPEHAADTWPNNIVGRSALWTVLDAPLLSKYIGLS